MQQHDETLSLRGKRWIWPSVTATEEQLRGSDPQWISTLLGQRGIVEQADVQRYLSPKLSDLVDPAAMADMDAAVRRLVEAIDKREAITVFGDYDVDGVCSTVVMVDFLRRVGAQVDFYIPERCTEGYGLNCEAVRRLASSTRLLVTVDCGITAKEEIALAGSLGMDVIVVDHHKVDPTLPEACACLDPHRPDCPYPEKNLCAAGVAFMLVGALRRALRERGAFESREQPDVRELLDVVALATVADMVPLRGTNRTLVAAGLRGMASTRRPGLMALLSVSNVDPQRATATDIGFRLGPRINARGRIAHAAEAVELLLTEDTQKARNLAAALDAANRERRELEKTTLEQAAPLAESQLNAGAPALVVHDPKWHPGVLGLVATRLVSRFNRPAVVIGSGGKGSGRTIDGLDLHAALSATSHLLERFGGHAAAAGLTLRCERVDAFARTFGEEVRRRLGEPPFVSILRPDLEVHAKRLDMRILADMSRLEPFGHKNPEPLFVMRRVPVHEKRVVGQHHLKLRLTPQRLDAIGFGLGELLNDVSDHVDVAFRLSRNDYQGRSSLQLKVEDLRVSV